jgi:catechol 2,3-dioxygenase
MAVQRLLDASVALRGASDHGVSIAVYLNDPDGNGLELTWDRPRDEWPRTPDGDIELTMSGPFDLDALLREARG